MAMAQADTVLLDEIQINAHKILKYSSGAKTNLTSIRSGTLSKLDSKTPSIYFKGYNDQLSTISFRGTSASHTAVYWNEIAINSPTLGQTDFSFWPGFLFENITIQFGGSAAQFGSGAIGGAVHLSTPDLSIDNKTNLVGLLKLGSFGRLESGVGYKYSNGEFLSETKIYRKSLQNNFEYSYRGESHTQQNAAVSQFAFSQKLGVSLGKYAILAMDVIYSMTDRKNQPIKGSKTFTELNNINFGSSISFSTTQSKYQFRSTAGLVIHDMNYNKVNQTKTTQLSWRNELDYDLSPLNSLKIGSVWNKYQPESDNFVENIVDDQVDFYAGYNFKPLSFWNVSLNLREVWYNGRFSPLSPSFGQQFNFNLSKHSLVTISNNVSRSFRIPTLNDRFWQPGGNPDLQNEIGWNAEIGAEYYLKRKTKQLKISSNHFRKWINDWIFWLPTDENYWAPTNARTVHVTGLEVEIDYKIMTGQSELNFNVGYSWTESLNKHSFNTQEINKQMPYVPIHNAFTLLEWRYKTWVISQFNQMTGLRYSSLDNSSFNAVDGYWLADLELSKTWLIKDYKINSKMAAKNILDQDYENIKSYAMPGINYSIEFQINF